MAKKKTSKAKKKTTKAKPLRKPKAKPLRKPKAKPLKKKKTQKNVLEIFTIGSSIMSKIVKHFKNALIDNFIIKSHNGMLFFAGMDMSSVSFCIYEISEGLAVENDANLVIDISKFEKILKTAKKELTIYYNEKSKIAKIHTGSIVHTFPLEDTTEFKDIFDYLLSDKIGEINYENWFKCDIEPDDFASVISVGKELDFGKNMYFEQKNEYIVVTLLEDNKVDESVVSIPYLNGETQGKVSEMIIHPKYIKIFDSFTDTFTLVITSGEDPIYAFQSGNIKDEIKFRSIIMVAPKKTDDDEDDLLVEEEDFSNIVEDTDAKEYEEEPEEDPEPEEEFEEEFEEEDFEE